jgi:PEP-CTERM motif
MKHQFIGLCIVLGATSASFGQTVLYDQMTGASNSTITSSWWNPDGSDYDTYTYDNFTLSNLSTIKEVRWRGAYGVAGYGGLTGFSVRFYESLAGGSQPKISSLPENETSADYLQGYDITGLAGETSVPGTSLYEYHYTLPTSLTLQANTKYWVKIVADMSGPPFWGMAKSTNPVGDNRCVQYFTGLAKFLYGPGDTGFQLNGGTAVPEPGSLAALGLGVGLLIRRRACIKRV